MAQWSANSRCVKVDVRVGAPLRRFTMTEGKYRRAFEGALREHLTTLLEDLAIPAQVSLEVESRLGRPALPMNSYALTVNGQPCRLPLPTIVAEDVDAQGLAASVYAAIHQNRALILSLPLSNAIRSAWTGERDQAWLSRLSSGQVQEYLAALIAHGIKIDRAKEFVNASTASTIVDWTPQELFELTVAGLDRVSLKAWLGEAQYRWLLDSGDAADASSPAGKDSLRSMLEMMRDGLFYELGLMLPMVDIRRDDGLDSHSIRFQFNDLRFPPQPALEPGEFLVNDTVDRLALLKLNGRQAFNPVNGSECAVISENNGTREFCEQAGLTTWDPAGYFILALSAAIRCNAGLFLNTDVVRFQLGRLEEWFPSLIGALESRIPIHDLTRILRELLEEELSIRDLHGILEALLSIDGTDAGHAPDWSRDGALAIRQALNRYISHKYTRGGNTIVVLLLDHAIEIRLMQDAPLEKQEHHRLLEALYEKVGGLPAVALNLPILTKIECRKKLEDLIKYEFPRIAVLCYQDLSTDMNIQPIDRVSWKIRPSGRR
jgi:hypothetical protein